MWCSLSLTLGSKTASCRLTLSGTWALSVRVIRSPCASPSRLVSIYFSGAPAWLRLATPSTWPPRGGHAHNLAVGL